MATIAQVRADASYERVFTLEDYLDLPLDRDAGAEQEVIRGKLSTMPRPSVFHQLVLRRLGNTLDRYLARRGWDDVQLVLDADLLMDALNSYLSPDLMLFPPEAVPALLDMGTRRRRIHLFAARPLLAVEILSPSGREQDLKDKRREYEAASIPHYWAFDQDARVMHEFVLDAESGAYRHLTHAGRRVRPRLFAGDRPALTLDLTRLWPDRAAAPALPSLRQPTA